jgi:exodeoxyribonuclease VII small subunit
MGLLEPLSKKEIPMTEKDDEINFEESLLKLEELVNLLESGDLTLEESLELFEQGQRLAALCNQKLEAAALRVEQLTSEGEIVGVEVK